MDAPTQAPAATDEPLQRWLQAAARPANDVFTPAAARVQLLLQAADLVRGGDTPARPLPPLSRLLEALRTGGVSDAANSWLGLFTVVARPDDAAPAAVEPGDLVLQHSGEDERFDVVAMVRDGLLRSRESCLELGLDGRGRRGDRFVLVQSIGDGGQPSALSIADAAGRVYRNTVVLRLGSTRPATPDRNGKVREQVSGRGGGDFEIGKERAARSRREAQEILPPIPDEISLLDIQHDEAEPFQRVLPTGCYILTVAPGFLSTNFQGTLRVHHDGSTVTASGDLYLDLSGLNPLGGTPGPSPSGGIPIYSRWRYNHYIRVTRLRQLDARRIRMDYEAWMYDHTAGRWAAPAGAQHAVLEKKTAPAGYRTGAAYFEGDTIGEGSGVRGTMRLGHVSGKLRKVLIEIDRVRGSESATASGAGHSWASVLSDFDVTVLESDLDVAEPSGDSWSNAELHAALLSRRDRNELDREWRYHLLCVKRLDATERGIMYDVGAADSNNVPREGAGISSHWTIPDTAIWGSTRTKRFGTAQAPYFRTAVHELSHAMGLLHPTTSAGTHIMQTTEQIAANATAALPFPTNITWQHADEDRKRLRHLPDHWVRPGGRRFDWYTNAPPVTDADRPEGLTLVVRPVLSRVPIGAPVRLEVELKNVSERPIPVPREIGLGAGNLWGTVTSDADIPKPFLPLVLCMDRLDELVELAPGASTTRSETLLRGPAGALFRFPGRHLVTVNLGWKQADGAPALTATTEVTVTPPEDEAHARAAEQVLTSPDALLTLALGGDHLADGIAAIHAGLENAVLRPHFAYLEAKRVAQPFFDRPPMLDEAARLMADATVVSESEAVKASQIMDAADAAHAFDSAAVHFPT